MDRLAPARGREPSTTRFPALVVSYADLLWRQEYTLRRLQAFLPEVGALSTAFEPQLGVDYFPQISLKTHGTIAQFADKHSPESLGYDLYDRSTRECAVSAADPEGPRGGLGSVVGGGER